MVEKETKDKVKVVDGIEERRVKSSVIRRRAKKAEPPKEEVEPVEAAQVKAPEPAAETDVQVKTEAPVVEAKKPAPEAATPPAGKAAAAPAKAVGEEAPSKKTPKKPAVVKKASKGKEAPKVEKSPAKLKVEAKERADTEELGARKEVKVFEAVQADRRLAPAARAFKMGKKKRGRTQGRFRPGRGQKAQSSRPLLKTEITTPKAAKRVIRILEAISVADLSQRLGVKAGEIIKKLMALGIMSTVNQLIDYDSAALVAEEFGYGVESAGPQEDVLIDEEAGGGTEDDAELVKRAPVVTVMGHVDHGKTSLLDVIRKTNVVKGEAGGITQHIGAYHVYLDKGDITFLDTPGHEAFTSMRARGAKATDIVLLVVAADDGVKPQTVEAINHAKAAEVPIIVVINKIDLPEANPDRVKQEMSQHGLLSEDWGGDTIFTEVSAKQGLKIQELLELIILQSDMLELKAPVSSQARGVIIEAKLDKGRGPVATVLIQKGTLKTGDAFVVGDQSGRVRAMINDLGKRVSEAGPSMPIEILGLSDVPSAGDDFTAVKDEATAKQVVSIRQRKQLEADRIKTAKVSLEDLFDQINKGEVKELKVVIKGDVQGSIEAVKDALNKLSTDAITLVPIHTGAGAINEGDCMLAAASNAIIVGFNVRPDTKAQRLAEHEEIDLRLYSVIYDLVEDVRNAMEGMLEPIIREKVIARAEVRDVIRITKVGNVAGSYVVEGIFKRNSRARLLRDNVIIYDAKIGSLKRFKEDAKEVAAGYECGITIEGYNDYKAGDVIEAYVLEEEAAKL